MIELESAVELDIEDINAHLTREDALLLIKTIKQSGSFAMFWAPTATTTTAPAPAAAVASKQAQQQALTPPASDADAQVTDAPRPPSGDDK